MTATQAAIWNVVENTDRYKYERTKSISSVSYKYFGRINWNTCSAYNYQIVVLNLLFYKMVIQPNQFVIISLQVM